MKIINLITNEPIKLGDTFSHTKIEKDNGKVSTTTIKCVVDTETIPYLTELGYIKVQEEDTDTTCTKLLDIFNTTMEDMSNKLHLPVTKLLEVLDLFDSDINPQLHLNVIVGIMAKALNKNKECGEIMYCISTLDHSVFEVPSKFKNTISGFYSKKDAEAVAKSLNLLNE